MKQGEMLAINDGLVVEAVQMHVCSSCRMSLTPEVKGINQMTEVCWADSSGVSDPPVGQRHALKQPGERGVDAQAAGAQRPVPVRVAPRPVHRVKVISQETSALPPARRRVAVGRRHHEVSAVDDLRAGERPGGRSGTNRPGESRLRFRVGVRGVLEVAPPGGTSSPLARHAALSFSVDYPPHSELSPQLTALLLPSFSPDIQIFPQRGVWWQQRPQLREQITESTSPGGKVLKGNQGGGNH